MKATLDIDIGGTFTDCLLHFRDNLYWSKTQTTPHNLSIGFKRSLELVAKTVGMSLSQLLEETEVIRYSTTLAMNTLIERKGSRLGLILTAGHEHMMLVGRARQWADGLHPKERRHMYRYRKPELLIPFDLTVGLNERIDSKGRVLVPLDAAEVQEKVHYLVDKGVRGFVVCFLWSFLNPDHERMVRTIIQEEYPENYLGNMPVLLSSDVQPKWHEYPRANMTILSAYMHTEMTDQMSALGEELRELGYSKPLVMVNNVGGIAKLARTRAVDTFGAGPIAGLFGAQHVGRTLGFPNILTTDMGGTSFDFGIVRNGGIAFYDEWPVIDRWATEASMVDVRTIGAGGGSIAWLNTAIGNRLEVGPHSAGANPGPACYDLGGTEPTVTDADVVLGYIDPSHYLGGRMRLNSSRAHQVMDKIARPLGMTAVEAAAAVRSILNHNIADVLSKELVLRGLDIKDFVLFAYGGGGPTHCADYGINLGVQECLVFPFASVFCALGGATLDLRQKYEKSQHLVLLSINKGYFKDYEVFNNVVNQLKEQALKDLASEGVSLEHAGFVLELDMRFSESYSSLTRVKAPSIYLEKEADVIDLLDSFKQTYKEKYSSVALLRNMDIYAENFCLTAVVPTDKLQLPTFPVEGENPDKALKGQRSVFWATKGEFCDTPIFDYSRLRAGNLILGPAVIEAADTTVVIPPDSSFLIDNFRCGHLKRK